VPPDIKVTVRENHLMITADLPGLRSDQLEITVEGKRVRLVSKQPEGCGPFESTVEIPQGYNLGETKATYVNGKLRLVIPPLVGGVAPGEAGPSPFSNN
jgi:HSP20 family molecular chaperone IbpA